ncbi:MAG: hypothetical protein MZV70_59685 [Desulfobacterales bacterium]|nr:hypothetical protein [Desulfobacterales bacterium]
MQDLKYDYASLPAGQSVMIELPMLSDKEERIQNAGCLMVTAETPINKYTNDIRNLLIRNLPSLYAMNQLEKSRNDKTSYYQLHIAFKLLAQ